MMTNKQKACVLRASFKAAINAIPDAHWCHRNKYEMSWEPDGQHIRCRVEYVLNGVLHSEIMLVKDCLTLSRKK